MFIMALTVSLMLCFLRRLPRLLQISCGMLGIVLLSASPAHAQSQPASSTSATLLVQHIDSTLDRQEFDGSHWGVAIMNLRTGALLYERNATRRFTPASNVKLYTTAAALEQLGPDYRYQTRLYARGSMENGVLQGDLVVRGAGDPTLGGYEQRTDPTAIFRTWADSLRVVGITHIQGNIIGDDNVFADMPLGHGWSWDDTPYAYAAELGGLVFNQNKIEVTIVGRTVGQPGRIHWEPANTDYVRLVNQTKTIASTASIDEEYRRPLGTNTIYLRSKVPVGRVEREDLAISNPTLYFTHVLRDVLLYEGLSVDGAPVDVDSLSAPPSYTDGTVHRIATYPSPPLAEIVFSLNHESLNLYAEQVLRTLGVERPQVTDEDVEPGSAEMGIEAAMRTLVRAGIDTSRIQLADGSGLSRHNLVTPQATVQLLRYMWDHPNPDVAGAFYASLPVGGKSGTLEYRYADGARARGQVHAKTGTLSNVSSLSGYITTAAGTPLAFSMMCNQYLSKTELVRRAQDVIVNALATYPN